MNKGNERAQDSLIDIIKLMISLSLGVLALSGTFVSQMSSNVKWLIILLCSSWIFLILSIFEGISALGDINHRIQNDTENWYKPSFEKAKRSWLLFKVGIVLLVLYGGIFGAFNAFINKANMKEPQKIEIINDKLKFKIDK